MRDAIGAATDSWSALSREPRRALRAERRQHACLRGSRNRFSVDHDVPEPALADALSMFSGTMLSAAPVATLAVGAAMLILGLQKHRLQWKPATCPVCGRPRRACTCRWR